MKKTLFSLIFIMSINMANAQIVNIPDTTFKAALLSLVAINTNGDAESILMDIPAKLQLINIRQSVVGFIIFEG